VNRRTLLKTLAGIGTLAGIARVGQGRTDRVRFLGLEHYPHRKGSAYIRVRPDGRLGDVLVLSREPFSVAEVGPGKVYVRDGWGEIWEGTDWTQHDGAVSLNDARSIYGPRA